MHRKWIILTGLLRPLEISHIIANVDLGEHRLI